jgi:polygalacturonase
MKNFILILLSILISSFHLHALETQVEAYDLPACYEESSSFTIDVSGVAVPVSKMFNVYEYAHYSFSGKTRITITVPQTITGYSITPLAYSIEGKTDGNKLAFELEQSRYLIIKINDYPELVIAADDLETDVPPASGNGIFNIVTNYGADPAGNSMSTTAIQNAIDAASATDDGIVYIPEGVYLSSNLVLKSNLKIYMEAGAVIRGTGEGADYRNCYRKNSVSMDGTWFIYTSNNASNIKIYGRGIIDGNGYNMRYNATKKMLMTLLMPLQCSNFTVDGILFRDSGLWGTTLTRSNDLTFLNTKHFNENNNEHENDAVDVQECQNVLFKHSIAISEDDTYSTKTWEKSTDIAGNWFGNPEILDNVVFDDCVAWSRCATFKVGFGICQDQSNIVFKNSIAYKSMRAIAVNHKYCPKPATNIRFENIDIEGFWPRTGSESICRWLEFDMAYEGGTVDGIYVKNIRVRNVGKVASVIKGYSATSPIKNITLENIYMRDNSEPAQTLAEMNITNTNSYIINLNIIVNPTGITGKETQADYPVVYPNPATGSIEVKGKSEKAFVSVFDNAGRLIMETIHTQIDTSSFPSGIYFIQVENKTVKLIKN